MVLPVIYKKAFEGTTPKAAPKAPFEKFIPKQTIKPLKADAGWKPQWQPKWQPKLWSSERGKQWQKPKQWQASGPKHWQATGPKAAPAGFEIDKEARHLGTVTEYFKWKGYGFIKPDEAGLVPDDKLYIAWQNIQSADRYPFLVKDGEVEFGIMKWKHSGKMTLTAKHVTSPGGGEIAVQDESDAKKEFIGTQHDRYKGTLKWYDDNKKYGVVHMEDSVDILEEKVPKDLQVEEHEVNCAGKRPQGLKSDIEVEFGIVKNWKGKPSCYNMTLPGGLPLTQENIEKRDLSSTLTFKGTVENYNKWGFGYIKPDNPAKLPPNVRTAMQLEMEEFRKKKPDAPEELTLYFRKQDIASWGKVKAGGQCTFQIYLDQKGPGACNIAMLDTMETEHAVVESKVEESKAEEVKVEESNMEESNVEESNVEESNVEESNMEESNIEEGNVEEKMEE